jgi:hypothetical protein
MGHYHALVDYITIIYKEITEMPNSAVEVYTMMPSV